jgi:hypothetical protein
MPWFADLPALKDYGATGEYSEDAAWAAEIAASNRQHPDRDTDNWVPKA